MKRRLFAMLLTGLALAMVVLIAIEIIPPLGPSNDLSNNESSISGITADPNASIAPPVFRAIVESGGLLRLAGTSEPEATLTLLGNREQIFQIQADKDGEWDAEITVEGADNLAIDMTLESEEGRKIWADETVLRLPTPNLPYDAEQDTMPILRQAMIIVTAPGGPSRIVQNPFGEDINDGALSMGPIDYDDSGGVIFSGRSTIPGRVRIYGDGAVIGETQISSAGRWFFIAADTLPQGPYAIGAELTTSNGILSRIDVVLDRMDAGMAEEGDINAPYLDASGNAWQIRRNLTGGGAQYTAIFNPNKLQTEE